MAHTHVHACLLHACACMFTYTHVHVHLPALVPLPPLFSSCIEKPGVFLVAETPTQGPESGCVSTDTSDIRAVGRTR